MGKIEIKNWTIKDPLNCIGEMSGVCWGAPLSEERNRKRAIECIKSGHGRVLELPDVYCVIDGYSGKCLREVYTHLGGLPTRMQASTRYIDYEKGFNVVVPPAVQNNDDALDVWNKAMFDIKDAMSKLKALNIPKEDYTNLLPLAYQSKMIWKINLRALINFMNMRLCSRAYWEIRQLANELKNLLRNYSDEWAYLVDELFVPKCKAAGYCIEKQCCGLMSKKEDVIK